MADLTPLPRPGFREMPWANGLGTTREIALDPDPGAGGAPFRWRLSMADLAGPGPFSELAGVDRILVLLAGEAVVLHVAGRDPAPLGRHDAIAFPGDAPTRLEMPPGAGRDLNLMWDRARATGRVDVLAAGDGLALGAPLAFAVALGGPARLEVDGATAELGAEDALRIDAGQALAVRAGDVYVAQVG
ncbi:MAG: HutD family protein [Actinomycetota bacterium]